MEIIWMPRARADFFAILDYLNKNWSNKEVVKFIETVSKSILLISKKPETFPLVRKRKSIHKFLLSKQNSIYYRINNDQIELLTIWDNRSNPKKIKL